MVSIKLFILATELILLHHLPITLPSEVTNNHGRDSPMPAYKYAAIVDCGSSGSRAHLFKWPADASGEEFLDKLMPMKDPITNKTVIKRIRPGLSSFGDQPDGASDYMRPIMDFISANVPPEAQPDTPVYFFGTAGLRLLSREKQQQILDDIVRDLTQEYAFKRLYGTIITGAQEGIFQWFSVNAHANRLTRAYDQVGPTGDFDCKAPGGRRFGIIEMGGASSQVSFELSPQLDLIISSLLKTNQLASQEYRRSQTYVRLGQNRTIRLFSTTFLGLGSNSARELAVDLLVLDSFKHNRSLTIPGTKVVIEDPCLPQGSEESVEKELDWQHYRSAKQLKSWRVMDQPMERSSSQLISVQLIGRGNYPACQKLLNRMIRLARYEQLNCGLSGQKSAHHLQQYSYQAGCPTWLLGTGLVPFKHMQIIGLSELFYTTKEIIEASGRFNPQLVQTRTNQVCGTPFSTLLQLFPEANRVDPNRVLYQCFKATWLLTFLHLGLRMPTNPQLLDFKTVDRINENELDWTFGAMLVNYFSSL